MAFVGGGTRERFVLATKSSRLPLLSFHHLKTKPDAQYSFIPAFSSPGLGCDDPGFA
jgi:hypothetical protein